MVTIVVVFCLQCRGKRATYIHVVGVRTPLRLHMYDDESSTIVEFWRGVREKSRLNYLGARCSSFVVGCIPTSGGRQ